MFVFEDMTSLRTIFDRYIGKIYPVFTGLYVDTTNTFRRSSDVDLAVAGVACNLCWRYLEDFQESYALAPSGQLVRLEDYIWTAPFDYYQPLNGLVNLKSGLLHGSDSHLPYHSLATCAEMVAPFDGCPVFLADGDNLFFEDFALERSASSALPSIGTSVLENELENWFSISASELDVHRPPMVETQYIDGENESPDVPDTNEFASLLDTQLLDLLERSVEPTRRAERSSHETIHSCVMQAFPDGKQHATWSDVETKVGYSRRSIVRALKNLGHYEDWA